MLDNIRVELDDIKDFSDKRGFNSDMFWIRVNRIFNLTQVAKATGRKKRNGAPTSLLFQVAVALPLFCASAVRSLFIGRFGIVGSLCSHLSSSVFPCLCGEISS